LVGVVVALLLHTSGKTVSSGPDQERPEIQIARIPVKGGMGLVFAVGTIVIFCLALAEVRWFVVLSIPSRLRHGHRPSLMAQAAP